MKERENVLCPGGISVWGSQQGAEVFRHARNGEGKEVLGRKDTLALRFLHLAENM